MTQPVNPTDDFWHQQFILLRQEHACVLNQLSVALQSIAKQSAEIQILKDEIARLKETSPRPKLPPNRLEGGGGVEARIKTNSVEESILEERRRA